MADQIVTNSTETDITLKNGVTLKAGDTRRIRDFDRLKDEKVTAWLSAGFLTILQPKVAKKAAAPKPPEAEPKK